MTVRIQKPSVMPIPQAARGEKSPPAKPSPSAPPALESARPRAALGEVLDPVRIAFDLNRAATAFVAKLGLGDLGGAIGALYLPPDLEASELLAKKGRAVAGLLSDARALRLKLAEPRLPVVDRATLQNRLDGLDHELLKLSGLTSQTAPSPGTGWKDPRYPGPTPRAGPRAVTTAPAPESRVSGDLVAHRASVMAHRAANGFPTRNGDLVGVHLALSGGGGKGKRYPAMLKELHDLGVVPVSLSGTSAGSIAAAVVAAGASPEQLEALGKDPRLAKLYDLNSAPEAGFFKGEAAYRLFDEKLREITGIRDRPVTFADLKVPLQIVATTTGDSERSRFADPMDRRFVFSQQNTPNTPVALAIRASMSIPPVFEPVNMADPVTGRQIQLVDGGVLDNLPLGYQPDAGLPVIGVSLPERSWADYRDTWLKILPGATPRPTPVDGPAHGIRGLFTSAFDLVSLLVQNGFFEKDAEEMKNPKGNHFMLGVPAYDLKDPSRTNSTLGFAYDAVIDPDLDVQTREVTRRFIGSQLGQMGLDPGARATTER